MYLDDVQALIDKCFDTADYEMVQIEEGSLGYGHFLLISNNTKYWSFEVWEEYLNEWSSTHRYRRFRKLSKRQQKEIEKAEARDEI